MADGGRSRPEPERQPRPDARRGTAREQRRRALAWRGWLVRFRAEPSRERLREWAIADTGPGRLLPWLPVAFGLGDRSLFRGRTRAGLVGGCCAGAGAARAHCRRWPAAAGRIPAGARRRGRGRGLRRGDAQDRRSVAHPVLPRPPANVTIAGFVEVREERERTDRIVVARPSYRRRAAGGEARTRARLGAQGHGAAGRRVS